MSRANWNADRLELIKIATDCYYAPSQQHDLILKVWDWLRQAFEAWRENAARHYAFDRLWKEFDNGRLWYDYHRMLESYETGNLHFTEKKHEDDFYKKLYEYTTWFKGTVSFAKFIHENRRHDTEEFLSQWCLTNKR